MLRLVLLLLALGSSAVQAGSIATVFANPSQPGATVPANFIGLSGEVQDFTSGFYQGTSGIWTAPSGVGSASAASYIATLNLLGISHGVLRLGGGTGDYFNPPTITSGMASNLNSFLGALGSGWSLVYNLQFPNNNPSAAASTATTLATAIGVGNIVFQMGNEPFSEGFTPSSFATQWNSYYSAVTTALPSAKFGAIDDEVNTLNFQSAAAIAPNLTPGLAGLQFLSYHWYSFCRTQWPNPTPAIYLNSIYASRGPVLWPSNLASQRGLFGAPNVGAGYMVDLYQHGSTPLIMSESNSICSEGQDGMSNKLMSSTWFLDMAIGLVNAGWTRFHIHSNWQSGVVSYYNPIDVQSDQVFIAQPIFYGMFLFSKVLGQPIIPSTVSGNGSANVQVFATQGSGGNANMIAVNNDPFGEVSITPRQSLAWTTANVLQVKSATNNGCTDSSLTVGGQPIAEGGTWSGAAFSISNGQSFSLGPCESAFVSIQP